MTSKLGIVESAIAEVFADQVAALPSGMVRDIVNGERPEAAVMEGGVRIDPVSILGVVIAAAQLGLKAYEILTKEKSLLSNADAAALVAKLKAEEGLEDAIGKLTEEEMLALVKCIARPTAGE